MRVLCTLFLVVCSGEFFKTIYPSDPFFHGYCLDTGEPSTVAREGSVYYSCHGNGCELTSSSQVIDILCNLPGAIYDCGPVSALAPAGYNVGEGYVGIEWEPRESMFRIVDTVQLNPGSSATWTWKNFTNATEGVLVTTAGGMKFTPVADHVYVFRITKSPMKAEGNNVYIGKMMVPELATDNLGPSIRWDILYQADETPAPTSGHTPAPTLSDSSPADLAVSSAGLATSLLSLVGLSVLLFFVLRYIRVVSLRSHQALDA